MNVLTEDAVILCDHGPGKVTIVATQDLVTIEQRRVLVARDPEGRDIVGCPNISTPNKPCMKTLDVKKGYSDLVFITGHAACLDTVTGLTDGTLPGTVFYKVKTPGQALVSEEA